MPKRERSPHPGDGGNGPGNDPPPIDPLADVLYTTQNSTYVGLRDENVRHLNGQSESQLSSQDIVVASDACYPVYSLPFRISYLYRSVLVTNVTRADEQAEFSPELLLRREAGGQSAGSQGPGRWPAGQRLRRALSNSLEGYSLGQPLKCMLNVSASFRSPECVEDVSASFRSPKCVENEQEEEEEGLPGTEDREEEEEGTEDREEEEEGTEDREEEEEGLPGTEDREEEEEGLPGTEDREEEEVFGEVGSPLRGQTAREVVPQTRIPITPVCMTAGCPYRRCSV